jgi:hypothetical protein
LSKDRCQKLSNEMTIPLATSLLSRACLRILLFRGQLANLTEGGGLLHR